MPCGLDMSMWDFREVPAFLRIKWLSLSSIGTGLGIQN